jgi:starch synthase
MVEEDARWAVKPAAKFDVSLAGKTHAAYLMQTALDAVPVYLVGTDQWFAQTTRSEEVYLPGHEQYLFFAQAVLEGAKALDWIPDVIHCNDWHTGFIPVAMREKEGAFWDETAAIYTIHNLAYQGEFDRDVLDQFGVCQSLYNLHQLETFGRVNFLKAGCAFSDMVNTVSETYAEEIQLPEFGCSLDGLMRHLALGGRLSGILNGIDTGVFDPASDKNLAASFDADDLFGKKSCRDALLKELDLKPIKGAPVMGVVSRLSNQKGMDLMLAVAGQMFALQTQMVILGTGDASLAEGFRGLQARFPKHLRFVERFDEVLAQKIYGGSDVFLMPSSFEPCGLGQMIALRYGTIPVVRRTGGLADTVFDGANGFVFDGRSPSEFLDAVSRAHVTFQDAAAWKSLVHHALSGEYSWAKSAHRYEALYERALGFRQTAKSA